MASKNERITELEKQVKEQDEMMQAMTYDISVLIKKVHELEKKNKETQYLG